MAMELMGSRWWAFVLRGVVAILFGVATFFMPAMALFTLVILFALYALIAGILWVAAGLERSAPQSQPRWALILFGIFSILAGIAAFVMPGVTALSLLYLIAAWTIVTGVLDIAAAIRLRKLLEGEWLYVLSGALSVLFGLLVMAFPGAGALSLALWIGAWAFASGVLLVVLGFELRAHDRSRGRGYRELATSH